MKSKMIGLFALLAVPVLAMSLAAAKGGDAPAALTEPKDVLAKLETAFNAGDPKAMSALLADDAHVITPAGIDGNGKANAEKAITGDINGILKGAKSKFSIESTRKIGADTLWVDATHEVSGAHGPDGKEMPTMKLHVVFLMVKKGGSLWIAEARPYAFLQPPPAK